MMDVLAGKILGKINWLGVPFYLDSSSQAHAIHGEYYDDAIMRPKESLAERALRFVRRLVMRWINSQSAAGGSGPSEVGRITVFYPTPGVAL